MSDYHYYEVHTVETHEQETFLSQLQKAGAFKIYMGKVQDFGVLTFLHRSFLSV